MLYNLITIAICLGIILLFRHADRNNRSLEKVKRFSDKQKEDFSAFVDSKMKNLEKLSIDVGVSIDRAGAALVALHDASTKLEAEEQNLAARREQVAEFAKKIGRIEQTVASLADAIAGADKSLSKLAEDSDFAESLAKKVQEAKKEFQDISLQIGQLEQRFTRENGAALASLREDVLSGIQAGLDDIQERTSRTMREAQDIEVRTKESLQRVFNTIVDKAGESTAAITSVKEGALSEIQAGLDQIAERTESATQDVANAESRAQESLQRTFDSIESKAADEIAAIASAREGVLSEMQAGMGQINERIESAAQQAANAESRAQENLQMVLDTLADKAAENDAALSAAREAIFSDTQAGLGQIAERIESAAREADVLESRTRADLQGICADVLSKATDDAAALSASQQAELAEMQAALAEIKEESEKIAQEAAGVEARSRESIQRVCDSIVNRATEDAGALAAEQQKTFAEIQAAIDEMHEHIDGIEREAAGIESRAKDSLQGICSSMISKAADDAGAFSAAHQGELAEMKAAIAEMHEHIDRIEQEAASIEERAKERLQGIWSSMASKAADDAAALSAAHQGELAEMQAAITEMHAHIGRIGQEAASIEERTKDTLQGIWSSMASKAADDAAALAAEQQKTFAEIQAGLAQIKEESEKSAQEAASAEARARESIQSVCDSIVSKATEDAGTLASEQQRRQSEIQSGLAQIKEENERIAQEAASAEARARESIQRVCDSIVSKATEDAGAIAAEQQKRQSEIQAGIAEMQERIGEIGQEAADIEGRTRLHLQGIYDSMASKAADDAAALAAEQQKTFEEIQAGIAEINQRAERTAQEAASTEERARVHLQSIYDSIAGQAAERAGVLEDQAFEELKQQSKERLASHKEEIDANVADVLQKARNELAESRNLLAGFKSELKAESDALLGKMRSDMQEFAANVRSEAEQNRHEQESFFAERRAEQTAFFQKIKDETDGIAESSAKAVQDSESRLSSLDARIAGFEADSEGQLERFRSILDEIPVIDGRIRTSLHEIETKSSAALELFTQDQNTRRDKFEAAFNARVESLMNKAQNLENAIAELKAHAYANVSEKVKIFEDDFFSDLKTRSDAMTAAMNGWRETIEQKLSSISAENESLRASAETDYTEALRERIAELESAYREQFAKTEGNIREAEKEMQKRIAENAAGLQTFTEQYRADFQQAREDADAFARRELQVHSVSLQEMLRVQQLEIENRYKELASKVDAEKESAESLMVGIRDDIADWQRRNEKAVEAAASAIDAKIEDFRGSSSAMIANVEASAQSEFSAAVARLGRDTDALRVQVNELREKIDTAGKDLDTRSEAALENFAKSFQAFSERASAQAREAQTQSESAALSLKTQAAEITASLEEARQRLFNKIQNDVNSVSDNLDEISARIKAFVEQSRVFTRADELKASLENSIEKLKIEAGNLNVYEEEMARLKAQYQQIREMSGDAEQKLSQAAANKKRIDGIESNFNLLLDIYTRTEEQISEMTRTKDDVLDYQARIRRFEESLNKMDERCDRVERKSLTIDQTLSNADKAFESLKELEKSMKDFRERTATVPADLEAIQTKINGLLENSERVGEIESKITQLESELLDTEKRAKRIQDDRKAYVNMEKRLIDLKNEADKAVGLFRALSMPDEAPRKGDKGAPTFEQRSYVKELKHRGWEIDQIAKNMKLSKAEVELILDEPD